MTTSDSGVMADSLAAAIRSHGPRTFPGFEAFADDPDGHSARRANARRVLAAQHVLETVLAPKVGDGVMLMKGLEVACLYPSVHMRPFRDVDVLVADAETLWRDCRNLGFVSRPSRRSDIDHHHLPALAAPIGSIGLEVHRRPNLPAWAHIDPHWILQTAEPSRTGIDGVTRPRDDVHALLMAFHAWKSGFTRPRDLYDAALLAAASDIPIRETARDLGIERFWTWTESFTRAVFLDATDPRSRIARCFLPRHGGIGDRKRTRIVTPFLVANPVRVLRGHRSEYELGRRARRTGDQVVT